MANVTAPILLDSTGQSILTQLTNINSTLQTIAEYSDITSGNTDIGVGAQLNNGVIYLFIPDE